MTALWPLGIAIGALLFGATRKKSKAPPGTEELEELEELEVLQPITSPVTPRVTVDDLVIRSPRLPVQDVKPAPNIEIPPIQAPPELVEPRAGTLPVTVVRPPKLPVDLGELSPITVDIPVDIPSGNVRKLDTREAVAAAAYETLIQGPPTGDKELLILFQTQEGTSGSKGFYGPGTGKALIKYGYVPPAPWDWPSNSKASKKDWRDNMLYMANVKDKQRADEWREAANV
jgi:hypothetical protein